MAVYRLRPDRTTSDRTGRRVCEVFGAADGHGDLSVSWFMLPSGCQGLDQRNDFVEVVIVLSGKGLATIDGLPEEVAAGHSIHVPRGALWHLDNSSREPLVGYSICSPAFRPELFHPAAG